MDIAYPSPESDRGSSLLNMFLTFVGTVNALRQKFLLGAFSLPIYVAFSQIQNTY